MPSDLALQLLRKGVRSMTGARSHCSQCGRSPLPGELVHVFTEDEQLCSLCRAAAHERTDVPLRTERVRTNNALVRRRAA